MCSVIFSALTLYVCTIVSFVNTRPPLRHLIPVLVIHWSGLAWNSLSEGECWGGSKQDGCVCPFANSSQLANALFSWSGYFKNPIQMFTLNSSWNGLMSAEFSWCIFYWNRNIYNFLYLFNRQYKLNLKFTLNWCQNCLFFFFVIEPFWSQKYLKNKLVHPYQ